MINTNKDDVSDVKIHIGDVSSAEIINDESHPTKRSAKQQVLRDYRCVVIYTKQRPYLIRFLIHGLILALAIRSWVHYKTFEDEYSDFTKSFKTKLIIGISTVDSKSNCDSIGYEDIEFATFPKMNNGCLCDYNLYTSNDCTTIKSSASISSNGCTAMNTAINNYASGNTRRLSEEDQNNEIISNNNENTQDNSLSRLLQAGYTATEQSLPTTCKCYKDIIGVESQTINKWIDGKKICILKSNYWTTYNYLKSSFNFRDCSSDNTRKCQKYFCKPVLDEVSLKKNNMIDFGKTIKAEDLVCPVVDAELTMGIYNDYDSLKKDPIKSIRYGTDSAQIHYLSSTDYFNKILFPMTSIKISLQNACDNTTNKDLIDLNFNLFNSNECAPSQNSYSIDTDSLKSILNINSGLYEFYAVKNPLFQLKVPQSFNINLNAEYAATRDLLSCYMTSTEFDYYISGSSFKRNETTNTYLAKLHNMVYFLFNVDDTFDWVYNYQLALLVLNCVAIALIFFALFTTCCYSCCYVDRGLIYKKDTSCSEVYLMLEIIYSFVCCIASSIVGIICFANMNIDINAMNDVMRISCTNSTLNKQYTYFTNTLEVIRNDNIAIAFIVFIKLLFFLFNVTWVCCAVRCKFPDGACNALIFENMNDGGSEYTAILNKEINDKTNHKIKQRYYQNNLTNNNAVNNVIDRSNISYSKNNLNMSYKEPNNNVYTNNNNYNNNNTLHMMKNSNMIKSNVSYHTANVRDSNREHYYNNSNNLNNHNYNTNNYVNSRMNTNPYNYNGERNQTLSKSQVFENSNRNFIEKIPEIERTPDKDRNKFNNESRNYEQRSNNNRDKYDKTEYSDYRLRDGAQ